MTWIPPDETLHVQFYNIYLAKTTDTSDTNVTEDSRTKEKQGREGGGSASCIKVPCSSWPSFRLCYGYMSMSVMGSS